MRKTAAILFALLMAGPLAWAQGFVDLGFESANLPPIPSGQFGGYVSITNALPGWTGFLGANQTTQVLQNNVTAGTPAICIFGPDFFPNFIIDGNYSAGLIGTGTSSSISQTGLVSSGTESLLFKAQSGPGTLTVSLGGQNISFSAISTGSDYTLYGGNISTALTGQEENLTFTALAYSGLNFWTLDDIQFSPQAVPEPDVFGLSTLAGGLFLGWRRWQQRGF